MVSAGILFIYSEISLDFAAKGFWRKRLRPLLNRQRLNTTRQVVRKAGQNYLYGITFDSSMSGFILAKDRIHFQTKGAPFAVHLITVCHSHLKTIHITFGSLNASNQSCDIEKALFFRTVTDMIECSRQYLFDSLWRSPPLKVFLLFFLNTYHVDFVPCNFSVQRKIIDFSKRAH